MQQYTLTGGQSLSTDNLGFVITATNTGTNLLQLKHRIGLATSVNDTYVAVAIGVNMASDGQPVLPAVAQATSFIRDQTRPSLSAFSLNLNNNTVNVFANEPLNTASYYPLGNTLQNSVNSTGMNVVSYTLIGEWHSRVNNHYSYLYT